MSDKQVKNFIMYYERLTKNMLKILPKKANIVIDIDKNHRLKSIKFN
jgi:D-glycerate 3-kinase